VCPLLTPPTLAPYKEKKKASSEHQRERGGTQNVIEEKTARGLDFGALREAIEARDAVALAGFYSEDAELRVVHAALPEGPAFELKGRAKIRRYLRSVCDHEMSCLLEEGVVIGEGSIEFEEICEYADGSAISVSTMLEVSEGLIVRQTDVVRLAAAVGDGGSKARRKEQKGVTGK
jgi:hypothetical protein